MRMIMMVVVPMAMVLMTATIGPTRCRSARVRFAVLIARMRMTCTHVAEIKPAGVYYKREMGPVTIVFAGRNV